LLLASGLNAWLGVCSALLAAHGTACQGKEKEQEHEAEAAQHNDTNKCIPPLPQTLVATSSKPHPRQASCMHLSSC
jgi:hypothetical protein